LHITLIRRAVIRAGRACLPVRRAKNRSVTIISAEPVRLLPDDRQQSPLRDGATSPIGSAKDGNGDHPGK
jgi:hypothetical protein